MAKKINLFSRSLSLIFVTGLLIIQSACQPPSESTPSPGAALVPPQVILLPTPTINMATPSEAAHLASPTSPATTPFPQTLPELALSVYGDRLIEYIHIPALAIYAPVTPVGWSAQDPFSTDSAEWDSPDAQVGWLTTSALPDDRTGKIVLYGHNNIDSSIFKYLYKLTKGDEIQLDTGQGEWIYSVDQVDIAPVDQGRTATLFDADPNLDEQILIIISCYPPDNNTQRVIVTSYPK